MIRNVRGKRDPLGNKKKQGNIIVIVCGTNEIPSRTYYTVLATEVPE